MTELRGMGLKTLVEPGGGYIKHKQIAKYYCVPKKVSLDAQTSKYAIVYL